MLAQGFAEHRHPTTLPQEEELSVQFGPGNTFYFPSWKAARKRLARAGVLRGKAKEEEELQLYR